MGTVRGPGRLLVLSSTDAVADPALSGDHRVDAVRAHRLYELGDADAARELDLCAAQRTRSLPERRYSLARERADPRRIGRQTITAVCPVCDGGRPHCSTVTLVLIEAIRESRGSHCRCCRTRVHSAMQIPGRTLGGDDGRDGWIFFESRGKARLKHDDHERLWYSEFHNLSPRKRSSPRCRHPQRVRRRRLSVGHLPNQ